MNNTAQTGCEQDAHGIRWLSGNIRRKLTLFVVLILIMVIGLFWFFSVYMLQPAYQNSIRSELSAAMGMVVGILNDAEGRGEELMRAEVLQDGTTVYWLADDVVEKLNSALQSGLLRLNNRCLEIADTRMNCVLCADFLESGCILHPRHETGITARGVETDQDYDSIEATLVRQQILAEGSVYEVRSGQIIMGTTTQSGSMTVVVSANMERIPQAVNVLKQLLFPLSLVLGLVSVTAAWGFSRWFTRPLNRLSVAARELARGNYDVRVADCGDDEIGDLARDFNMMAREVGRSAELQRDLMANVSHDLRTPLTLIKGYAETVRDLTGDNEKKRTEQLNVIVDESDRLSDLVGSVLELSRMSSGTEKPEPVQFDLNQLCDEVAYRYEEYAKQNGYHFVFTGQEGCQIYADPKLSERVLVNLLSNAMQHVGDDGYIGLTVYKTDRGTARCEVADHGPGIAAEDLPHLFDRYYRSRADAGKQGTGLGLSITLAIFVAMNFDYGVISAPGAGSTFWFEVQLDETAREAPHA